jgi:hypothetical protein
VLAEDIEDTHDEPTDETPTYGVVDDGRKYPAVTARRRQQQGSPRSTLYTVSKNGKYAHLYNDFERDVIEPYRARKRKRTVDGGSFPVNTSRVVEVQASPKSPKQQDGRSLIGFPVNTVDG